MIQESTNPFLVFEMSLCCKAEKRSVLIRESFVDKLLQNHHIVSASSLIYRDSVCTNIAKVGLVVRLVVLGSCAGIKVRLSAGREKYGRFARRQSETETEQSGAV